MSYSLFKHLRNIKEALITTHRHADIDAYCSVYALSKILFIKGIDSKVYFPEGLNDDAKRISSILALDNIIDNFVESKVIFILDTNNPELLPNIYDKIKSVKKIIIDHHPLVPNSIKGIEFINTNVSSTCTVIHMLCRRVKLSKDIAMALLLGIFTDSQYLTLADEESIRSVSILSKYVPLIEIRKILAKERDYSERLARLKALKRMELYKMDNDLIIAISRVGSYQSSAAKVIIDAGADLSIVINKDKNIKVSMRSSNKFYSITKLHLGIDIASAISTKGGGHATAASFESEDENSYKEIFGIIKRLGYEINNIS